MSAQPTKITNVNSKYAQLPLVAYCIKAAYNSAFDGSSISLDALDAVILSGCRFLDFEVFYVEKVPVVGVSIDPQYRSLISSNTLPLGKILAHILSSCFYSSSKSPNPQDPLFINLRVKTSCNVANTAHCDVYSALATVLAQTTPVLYVNDKIKSRPAKPVNSNTLLAELMGKMVITMDASLSPQYGDYAADLSQYVNADTGNTDWAVYEYSDFLTMQHNVLTTRGDMPLMAEPQKGVLRLSAARPDAADRTECRSRPVQGGGRSGLGPSDAIDALR
jgi:hypothetical protein